MKESKPKPPEEGGDFPEVDLHFEGSMEEEILNIVVEALNKQGYPTLAVETLKTNDAHRAAALDMLRDCRPLPVVRQLIDKIETGRI